mmetsp:Transcript_26736/g.54687  ORF Transcript_26736/g.54687 Transcript_26736/m.54687 type:complete len:92 (-) Transcript_26736:98-373(-)
MMRFVPCVPMECLDWIWGDKQKCVTDVFSNEETSFAFGCAVVGLNISSIQLHAVRFLQPVVQLREVVSVPNPAHPEAGGGHHIFCRGTHQQ